MSSTDDDEISSNFAEFLRTYNSGPREFDTEEDTNDGEASDAELHKTMPPTSSGQAYRSNSPDLTEPAPPVRHVHVPEPEPQEASEDDEKFEFVFTEDAGRIGNATYEANPNLLHELAEEIRKDEIEEVDRAVPRTNMGMSSYFRSIVRECEFIIFDSLLGTHVGPKGATTVDDMRLLLGRIDDLVLMWRPEIANNVQYDEEMVGLRTLDRPHQRIAFIARMKLLYAIRLSAPRLDNASRLYYGDYRPSLHIDEFWFSAAFQVTDVGLVRWLAETNACHPSLIRINPPRLLIQSCTIGALWQSFLCFMSAWPKMRMCGEVVRYFDELRLRAAFFLSYREEVDENEMDDDSDSSYESDSDDDGNLSFEKKLKKKGDERILGLKAASFSLSNFGRVMPGKQAPKTPVSLFDDFDFWETSRTDDRKLYKQIKLVFIEQTERVLHAFQLLLRKNAGFRQTPVDEAKRKGCYLCSEYKSNKQRITHVQNVVKDTLDITNKEAGTARVIIEERFREEIYKYYIEPSELETFTEYHPQEVSDELNAISKRRNTNYMTLNSRFTTPDAHTLWTEKELSTDTQEPAHALLMVMAFDHLLNARTGIEFGRFVRDTKKLTPFPYRPYMKTPDKLLIPGYILNDFLETTGTLKYRFKIRYSDGGSAPMHIMQYAHPVILKMINSFWVVYNGHLHEFGTVDEAVSAWAITMCLDDHIYGYTGKGCGKPIHEFATLVAPDMAREIKKTFQVASAKISRWNPASKYIKKEEVDLIDGEDNPGAAGMSSSSLQHEMYQYVSQFKRQEEN